MKNKISTKDKFLKLREQIKKYNNSYYNSKPDITDSEFDKLKVRYEKVLNENSSLMKFDNIGVGALPSSKFKKMQHKLPMLSLSNSFKLEDLDDFFNKANNFLKDREDKYTFIADCKIDGVSLSLTYEKKKLIKALTRGDGITGEDITDNILGIDEIPKSLKFCISEKIEIRGEVFISKKDFRSLNNFLDEKNRFSIASNNGNHFLYLPSPTKLGLTLLR